MSHLRIAMVCHEYPPSPHGGIGTVTRNLARGLVATGNHVRVIGCYSPSKIGEAYEEDQGVEIYRLKSPTWRLGWIQARIALYRTVARWSRQGEIDLIELPDWEGWAAAWPPLSTPVVVRLNGSSTYFAAEAGRKTTWRTRWIERSSILRASQWISCSQYTAGRTRGALGVGSDPSAIIPNSVDLREYRDLASRSPHRVIFSGTLTEKKGVISLIRAWPDVVRQMPEARLDIYGKDGGYDDGGSMHQFLESLLPHALQSTVRFHGHQNQEVLLEALQDARVAVFPSYAEAFALAPMEAMACGCPTIYSLRGSGPELIDDGVHGLLIDPSHPADIGGAITKILSCDDLAASIGREGWKRIRDRFSIARIVGDNVNFYRNCVEDFKPSRASRFGVHVLKTH